jgi:hypothetical protein
MVPPEKEELRVWLKLDLLTECRVCVEPYGRDARVQPLVLIDAVDLRIRNLDLVDEVADDDAILASDDCLERKARLLEEQSAKDRRNPERDGHAALVGAREQGQRSGREPEEPDAGKDELEEEREPTTQADPWQFNHALMVADVEDRQTTAFCPRGPGPPGSPASVQDCQPGWIRQAIRFAKLAKVLAGDHHF